MLVLNCTQRGFYADVFDAYVIYSICKADSHRKFGRSGSVGRDSPAARRAATRENTPPGVRVIRDLWPRRSVSGCALRLRCTRPSGAVAAQRVKFVV